MGHIFYLVYYGYEKTVIESQVVTPAKKMKDDGFTVSLIFFENFGTWLNRASWRPKQKRLRDLGFQAVFLPRVPRNFLAFNSWILLLVLRPFFKTGQNVVVHARGFQGTTCVALLKRCFGNVRVVCDSRGVEAEEYEFDILDIRQKPLNAWELKWKERLLEIERSAVQNADVVFSVSKAMIELLKRRDGLSGKGRWEHVPCAVHVDDFVVSPESRESIRRKMGFANRFVVLYCGSTRNWQSPHLLPKIFKSIRSQEPTAFFCALTPSIGEITRIFEASGFSRKDFEVRSVPHEQVAAILPGGDLGLLLREESPVNAYACPTKFAEYLASGLHVVTTDAVWDIAELIKQEPVGTLLKDLNDEKTLQKNIESAILRAKDVEERISRGRDAARRHFDWEIYVPRIKKWYLQLLQN